MDILEDFDLSKMNTFRLQSRCRYFCELKQKQDISDLRQFIEGNLSRMLILGGGSNLILPKFFDGLVVQPAIKGFSVQEKNNDIFLQAGAGEQWADLISFCLEHHYLGLENLTLIPGRVGAAPIQNIGAYGVEVEQFINSVEVFDFQTHAFKTLAHDECRFAYRDSLFKQAGNRYLILAVNFILKKQAELNCSYQSIQTYLKEHNINQTSLTQLQLSELIANIRLSRLPNPETTPNVGSFFKNPIISKAFLDEHEAELSAAPVYPQDGGSYKVSAAWLIEQSNLKGYQYKNLRVSGLHALVIENMGQSEQGEVLELAEIIQAKVKDTFAISLEIEPVQVR